MKTRPAAILAFLGMVSLMSLGSTWAASLKIGVIDTDKILRESVAAKNARAVLLDDLKEKRALFTEKQEAVGALEEELRDQAQDMSPSERKEKTDALSKELKNLKRLKDDLEEELNKKNVELTQKILKEVGELVREYFEKKNYSVILEKKSVVISDDDLDITDEIIRLYDMRK
jgi:outer membrane protein